MKHGEKSQTYNPTSALSYILSVHLTTKVFALMYFVIAMFIIKVIE